METIQVQKNGDFFTCDIGISKEEWLDFIVACRRGQRTEEYDLVMGGVANDKVFDTVELFFTGLIDKSAALGRLQFQQPNYQICLRTQAVINQYLHFIGSDIV